MLIIETSVFTRRVLKLLSDENYRSLQQFLVTILRLEILFAIAAGCAKSGGAVRAVGSGAAFGLSITGLQVAKRFSCC